MVYGGCHGDDELQVFAELCQVVKEVIQLYRADGKPLPPLTSVCEIANRLEGLACSVDQLHLCLG